MKCVSIKSFLDLSLDNDGAELFTTSAKLPTSSYCHGKNTRKSKGRAIILNCSPGMDDKKINEKIIDKENVFFALKAKLLATLSTS
jgi:hypothetical protein